MVKNILFSFFNKISLLKCYLMPNCFVTKRTMSLLIQIQKIIHHKGYKFNKKWERKIATTYWCTNCKSSESKCSSKIKVDFWGEIVNKSGSHDVECNIKTKTVHKRFKNLQMHTTIIRIHVELTTLHT